MNCTLASGETTYPDFNTWGTDFGNPGTSMLQPAALTLALCTEQPANPIPAVKPATTTTIATSPLYGATFWEQWTKHFAAYDAGFNSLNLDPQNPGAYQARIVQLTSLAKAASF